ncbi:hypothetical protein Ancab_028249 [Ancistrocladus abbreviatus]
METQKLRREIIEHGFAKAFLELTKEMAEPTEGYVEGDRQDGMQSLVLLGVGALLSLDICEIVWSLEKETNGQPRCWEYVATALGSRSTSQEEDNGSWRLVD